MSGKDKARWRQDRTGPDRTGEKTGQYRAGKHRIGQDSRMKQGGANVANTAVVRTYLRAITAREENKAEQKYEKNAVRERSLDMQVQSTPDTQGPQHCTRNRKRRFLQPIPSYI